MNFITLLQQKAIRRHLWLPLGLAIFVAIIQPLAIGTIYSEAKALELLQALKDASLFFGSGVATASATILALMLTIISLIHNADKQFERGVYIRIRAVAVICAYTFLGSILLLLLLILPVREFQQLPGRWFMYFYYILSFLNGLLAGCMAIIILILRTTVLTIINKLSPDFDKEAD